MQRGTKYHVSVVFIYSHLSRQPRLAGMLVKFMSFRARIQE